MEWLSILGWGQEQLEEMRFIGYSYIKQGKYDVALTFFEALAILEPHSLYDIQTLGALYLQMNNNTQALNTIDKALKIDPTHLPSLLNRTKALFMLGYKRQALAQARALETCHETAIADQAQALIMAYGNQDQRVTAI